MSHLTIISVGLHVSSNKVARMFFVKLVLTISLFEFCKSEGNITKRSTDSIECGTPHGLGGFVFKGETVDRYEFPWYESVRSNFR